MTSDFFKGFLTYLPTHVRFCPNKWVLFYLVVSDFCKPTYLPKNRTSYVDGPYDEKVQKWSRLGLSSETLWTALKTIATDKFNYV